MSDNVIHEDLIVPDIREAQMNMLVCGVVNQIIISRCVDMLHTELSL